MSLCTQDPNVRLIRELRAEIKRLKMIISDGDFVSVLNCTIMHVCRCFANKRRI